MCVFPIRQHATITAEKTKIIIHCFEKKFLIKNDLRYAHFTLEENVVISLKVHVMRALSFPETIRGDEKRVRLSAALN